MSSTASRISVIVPAKDAEATITRALGSTLRALPDDARVFVRSDGSTDDTVGRARALGDRRVTVVEGTSSIGVAASLNELLDLVDTPLVARMDADDVTLPWRFRHQVPRIAAGDDLVFTTTVSWFEDRPLPGRLRPPRAFSVSPPAAPLSLLLENGFGHPTLLARTGTMRRLGGYRHLPSEDFDLWVRAALDDARLSRTAVPGVVYRRHAGQVTADAAWQSARAADGRLIALLETLGERELGFRPAFLRWRKDGYPSVDRPATLTAELEAVTRRARHLALPVSDRIVLGVALRRIRAAAGRAS